MKRILIAALVALALPAVASIPPTRMIFDRLTDQSGSGGYVIEQEVQFQNGAEPLVMKETWIVESDRSMRVNVTGPKELKGPVSFQILYAGGQRWIVRDGKRISEKIPVQMFERAFHLRTLDSVAAVFGPLQVFPLSALEKKPAPRRKEDVRHEGEDFVRLGRTGGVVAWMFGKVAPADSKNQPAALWIEQDQFVVRRIRWPSGDDLTADRDTTYARGLRLPRLRTVRWGENTATVRLLSASARTGLGPQLQPSAIERSFAWQGLDDQPAKDAIREFYTRFR